MEFWVIVLTVAVAVLYFRQKALADELERRRFEADRYIDIMQSLVRRVHQLERAQSQPQPSAPPAPEPQVEQPVEVPVPPVSSVMQEEPTTVEAPAPVYAAESTRPPFLEEEEPAAQTDWEAVLGGNILNKIGALILVVGIALFLGYSFTILGPAGKVAIGFAIGISMLVGGVIVERKPPYVSYGRGLIGGGWAAIYFTTYAAHDLEAARIIQDRFLGSALLMMVAAGMIVHSLFYKRESITGLAYIIGFITLAISPLTGFSLAATLLLAVSLLTIAHRSSWFGLGLLGVVLSYGVFLVRYNAGIYAQPGLFNGQALLWIYWTTFEIFDHLQRRRPHLITELEIEFGGIFFWVNALGFITGTLVHITAMQLPDRSGLFAAIAVAFALSAAARYWQRRDGENVLLEFVRGDFGSAALLSAIFAVVAIHAKYASFTETILLLVTAQVLVVLGQLLSSRYLRILGGLFHSLPLLHWLDADSNNPAQFSFGGITVHYYSLTGLLIAITFLGNRLWTGRGWLYGSAASFLLSIVIDAGFEKSWGTVAWAVLTGTAMLAGNHLQKKEMLWQGYLFSVVTIFRAFYYNVDAPNEWTRVGTTCLVIGIYYAAYWLLKKRPTWIDDLGQKLIGAMPTILLAYLIHVQADRSWATVLWAVLTSAAVVIGTHLQLTELTIRKHELRWQGYVFFAATIVRSFVLNTQSTSEAARITTTVLIIAIFYLTYLFIRDSNVSEPEVVVNKAFGVAPSVLLAYLLNIEVQGRLLTVAWGLQSTALLIVGFAIRDRLMRISGLVLFLLCVVKLFFYDLSELDTWSRIISFIVLGLLLLGASWVYTRFRDQLRRLL
ncbi:MAG TPA: DUF2339 domain-containing protein [Bryobacteraceae bacterium]|nr:DUF2339 domain-containing protein [Bryobacteraceae bacterium]